MLRINLIIELVGFIKYLHHIIIMRTHNTSLDEGKTIHWRRGKQGWSMVIMPESIRIDNNHGYCHIHLEYKKNYYPIKDDSFQAIYQGILKHVQDNKGINLDKLQKELHFSRD